MPQRLVTFWSCSLCPEETDNEEKMRHYTLSEGKRALVLDVCTTCEATEPFATIVAAGLNERIGARKSGSPKKNSEDDLTQCELCGEEFTVRGIAQHKVKAHELKSATALMKEQRGKVGEHLCEDCGFRAKRPQGLVSHRRSEHPEPAVRRRSVKK